MSKSGAKVEVLDADLDAVLQIGSLPASRRTNAEVQRRVSTEFVRDHPALIAMLVSPRLRAEILRDIVAGVRRVRDGHQSAHDASVDFGTSVLNAYVPAAARASSSHSNTP